MTTLFSPVTTPPPDTLSDNSRITHISAIRHSIHYKHLIITNIVCKMRLISAFSSTESPDLATAKRRTGYGIKTL